MSSAILTNQETSEVFNFPDSITYISTFPEGEGCRKDGEYVLSVGEDGKYVAGGKITNFYPTSYVGKKITISGSMPYLTAVKIDEWWNDAVLLRLETQRYKAEYDFYVKMSEPKWSGTGFTNDDDDEEIQYTIDFWIQYVEE